MNAGSLLLPALALGLGCLIALCWLIYRLTRARGREATFLGIGGGLALLAGAGAVLLLWPMDRRAFVRFESAGGAPLVIEIGELELGQTPLQFSLADFFTLTHAVPAPPSPPPVLDVPREARDERLRGIELLTRWGPEGVHVQEFADAERPMEVRFAWGPMLPGSGRSYPLVARSADTGQTARLGDLRLERSGVLGRGPRSYRIVLRAD